MTTLHRTDAASVAFSKGAAEAILSACDRHATVGGTESLGPEAQGRIEAAALALALAQKALRVLAYKPEAELESAEQGMTFLGLMAMIDPPRAEAKEAIAKCEHAGIRPIMICKSG